MMKQNTDDNEKPRSQTLQRVPMHCSFCGALLGYFSPASHADLELRCSNCKNDYSIRLREDITALEHKRSRKTQATSAK